MPVFSPLQDPDSRYLEAFSALLPEKVLQAGCFPRARMDLIGFRSLLDPSTNSDHEGRA